MSSIKNSNRPHRIKSTPINPFEDVNKMRLEQSVLSPNLFHVTNTYTPERDTGSLWNIDQRAVLYPADIPTDEHSLFAQYIHDHKMNKQLCAAIESFWSQNTVVIESPASSYHSLKAKFKKGTSMSIVNSPCHEAAHMTITNSGSKLARDQTSQTALTFPSDLDMEKLPAFRQYLLMHADFSPCKETLNNSIRKKLFDHNSDDADSSPKKATSESPVSIASSEWTENVAYQDQFASSPKLKQKTYSVSSTPEISPFITHTLAPMNKSGHHEKTAFPFPFPSMHQSPMASFHADTHHQHHVSGSGGDSQGFASPNLSPIKEGSPNLSPIRISQAAESNNTLKMKLDYDAACMNGDSNNALGKSVIYMDIDTGAVLKVPLVCRDSFIDYDEQLANECNDMTFKTKSSQKGDQTTQEQDTGYHTGVSTQMDITNSNQDSINVAKKLFGATKNVPLVSSIDLMPPPSIGTHLKTSASVNFLDTKTAKLKSKGSKIKEDDEAKSGLGDASLYKATSSHSLPSLGSLYPLGSSTPERAKKTITLSKSLKQSVQTDSSNCNTSCMEKMNTSTGFHVNNTNNATQNMVNDSDDDASDEDDEMNFIDEKKLLMQSARELDSSYMESSILKSKSPSTYAKAVIERAKHDLEAFRNFELGTN